MVEFGPKQEELSEGKLPSNEKVPVVHKDEDLPQDLNDHLAAAVSGQNNEPSSTTAVGRGRLGVTSPLQPVRHSL